MSDPVVTSDDLAIYLGIGTINEDRADMLLADAQALCELIVTPLPAAAAAIIRNAAARAYQGSVAATSETIGPYTVNRAGSTGGVYLTKAERRTLRNSAGRSGAFSVDLTPAAALPNLAPWNYDPSSQS